MPELPQRNGASALAMALYWHSLAGAGFHFVARDDLGAQSFHSFFGPAGMILDCPAALVVVGMTESDRRAAYEATVTCGSYAELAYDYLRDHLHRSRADTVQRGLYAAVVGDPDAILGRLALTHLLI